MKIYEKDGAVYAEKDGWTVAAFGKPVYEFMGKKEPPGLFNWVKSPDGNIGAACNFVPKLEKLGFPVNSIGLRKYHQTLRDLMEKPYGHAGEWERDTDGSACDHCLDAPSNWYAEDYHDHIDADRVDRVVRLCQSCFDRYVSPAPAETPEKRPITEWSDDLIGATVEALVENGPIKKGERFTVLRDWGGIGIELSGKINCWLKYHNLTLISKAPAEKRPIDPAEVDETWVGATVECLVDKPYHYRKGDNVIVGEIHHAEEVFFVPDKSVGFWFKDFTLVSKPPTEKRPIDPAEVDESWVGATVECVTNTGGGSYEIGEVFKIRERHSDWEVSFFMEGQKLAFDIRNFTLVKKATHDHARGNTMVVSGCENEEYNGERQEDTPKTRTEVTHSAELEFPNGQRVTIPPPPDSEGWEAVHHVWMYSDQYYSMSRLPWVDCITHDIGLMMKHEYHRRALAENPRIVSLTKWVREVVMQSNPIIFVHTEDKWKSLVESTWPQRHPPGAVKEREEREE
jgi:hypothetical protein